MPETTPHLSSILKIDNSKRSSFTACPRKYFYRYIHHLTGDRGSSALRFGSTWHGLMEGYYSSIVEHGWDADHTQAAFTLGQKVWEEESEDMEFYEDYRTLENCFESFVQYLEEFQADRAMMNILASERIFDIHMELFPEEEALYPTLAKYKLHFTGKLDLEAELGGQHWIMEFKSTGQPIRMQADRLQRSAQILGYTWAAKHLGQDIVGTLVSIHQILSRKVKSGGYGKTTRNYLRQPNVFSEADLVSWRQSHIFTCNLIAEAMQSGNYPCQYDSCYQFGRCGFTQLCEQNRPLEDLNLEGFTVKKWDVLESGPSQPLSDTVIVEA